MLAFPLAAVHVRYRCGVEDELGLPPQADVAQVAAMVSGDDLHRVAIDLARLSWTVRYPEHLPVSTRTRPQGSQHRLSGLALGTDH
jgi:hypothetical protein